ncbi:MAG: hypothetical protein ACRDRL_02480 [Sciscionella sp.]
MNTARPKLNTQQVRDAGQYFVAAEISRQGGYAVLTPGNRKRIDILANDVEHKRFIGIQVKTKTGKGGWQADTRSGQPHKKPKDETAYWVLVDLSQGDPQYYVMPAWWIENDIHTTHHGYLHKHGGHRPHTDDSTHHLITVQRVEQWKDRWDVLGIF